MKKIIIIGAGDGGRLVSQLIKEQRDFEIAGFIDDNPKLKGKKINGYSVLSSSSGVKRFSNYGFLVSLGMPMRARSRLFDSAKKAGLLPVNFVHRSAIIGPSVKMGKGVIILPGCVVNPFTILGDNIFIFSATVIEHDCRIADNVYFSPGVKVAGHVKVGRDSFLGINSCVIEGVNIGSHTIVGAGACVLKEISSGLVAAGVPAKILRKNDE